MIPRTDLRGRCLAAVFFCLAAADPAPAQESGDPLASTRLDFSRETARLADDAAVESWVVGRLHRQLGLAQSDRLQVAGQPRRLGDHTIYNLAQTVSGLPVVYRESRLLLDGDRKPISLLGHHTPFPNPPSAQPKLSLNDALAAARSSQVRPPTGRIIFWPDGGRLRLSYELQGWFSDNGEANLQRVYVDAHNGEVLERLPLTHHGLARRVYDFGAACRGARVRRKMRPRRSLRLVEYAMRTHVRSEASRPGNVEVERLFESFGEFYRFLNVALDMDSFDGHGAALRGFVGMRFHPKAQTPQCTGDHFNSFWYSGLNALFLPTAALDYSEVIGHEIGHGIVQSGSGLVYKRQSGALNESIADAVGVTFRAWLENGGRSLAAHVPDRIWKLRKPGGVIRDMKNPGSLVDPLTGKPYPDHFDDYRTVDDDNGGVHVNSSIMNQGYYLLAMGGQHPRLRFGPEVQGLGLSKALKIFGRAGADLLTPNSGFMMARYAFAEVARILFGEFSQEWIAAHTAMDAIGIPGNWPRPPPPPLPPKPAPPPEPQENAAPKPKPVPDPGSSDPVEPGIPTPGPSRGGDAPDPSRSDPVESEPEPKPEPAPPPKPAPQPRADPVPAPVPGPSKPDPPSPEPEESLRPDQPPDLMIAAVLLLVVAAVLFVVVKSRPGKGRLTGKAAARIGEAASGAMAGDDQLGPESPAAGAAPIKVTGTLIALDGSPPISLRRDLLTSTEGLVIGRARELCHVQIRDPQVSRRHLRLRLVDRAVWVEDLNSMKGTEVNGNRMEPFEPVRLRSGQLVRIASLSYQFKSV